MGNTFLPLSLVSFYSLFASYDEIRKSKKECFKKLCAGADNNLWGSAFKVVMKNNKGPKQAKIPSYS